MLENSKKEVFSTRKAIKAKDDEIKRLKENIAFWQLEAGTQKLNVLALKKQNEIANVFVAHIDNHIIDMVLKGELPQNSKVMCKICKKDIDTIYKEELKTQLEKKNG